MFAGEVITTFEERNVMRNLVMSRVISSGKSAAFPVTGVATTKYHIPGENILEGDFNYQSSPESAEKEIFVDRLLLSSVFMPKIHEKMLHYDLRSIYSTEIGRALAKKFDVNALIVAIKAARASANLPSGKVGGSGAAAPSACTNANMLTSGADILAALFAAAQRLDENDVPESDRYALIKPSMYYALVQNQDLLNRDFGGANGVFSDGTVYKAAGITLVKTTHIPTTTLSDTTNKQDATQANDYQGAFGSTAGIVFHKSATGVVRLEDLAVETEYKIEYQGSILVAKYAVGHGILRPEGAVELRTAI
jgi:hypothetical protein